jgi:hypothetical protein
LPDRRWKWWNTVSSRDIFYRRRNLCGMYRLPRWKIWQLYCHNERCVYRAMCGGLFLPRRLIRRVRWHSYYGGSFYDSMPRRNIFYRGRNIRC